MTAMEWKQHLSTVEQRGWSTVPAVPEAVYAALRQPFTQDHAAGVFLELSRTQTLGFAPSLEDFVSTLENSSLSSPYEKLRLEKVWFQESNAGTTSRASNTVPFVPHIDGSRYFKVMIYMNDISLDDGPMHIASQEPHANEARRQTFDHDYKELELNRIREVSREDLVPLVGQKGSAVLFDTNTPHAAGQVSEDGLRQVVRLDFNCSQWSNKRTRSAAQRSLAKRYLTRMFH